jgi:mitogen-activated protein kinase kinase
VVRICHLNCSSRMSERTSADRLPIMQFTQQQRPMGPRSNPRSVSPAPSAVSYSPPGPRKLSASLQPPTSLAAGRPPTPSLSLQIPGLAKPTPKGKLPPLAIPVANGANNHRSDGDSPVSNAAFQGGYYGGPTNAPQELGGQSPDDGGVTITPFQIQRAATPKPSVPIADLRQTLQDLSRPPSDPVVTSNGRSTPPSVQNDEESTAWGSAQWSDDRLEEISRLGEGAGGAVHKVKDKRTGLVIARKTITTREAPMKQLLREITIIASAMHPNIIVFHGAYMSPSSSEVKILMEFCEGGSLEAVGKRIKDVGGRVGEKVAGRLAEGVG